MTPWLTYGDRMGTTNHDMECIKESFFPSKLLLKHFQVLDKFISLEMFYTGGTLFRLQLMRAGRIKYRVCPHAFWKACLVATDKQQQTEATRPFTCSLALRYICLCVFCRLCTRAQRRAGRSTAQHRTQMGSVSAPWSHRPRTCVTATHAAGNFASSWRRWQLSIAHPLWDTTVTHADIQTQTATHCLRSRLVPSVTCTTLKWTVPLLSPHGGSVMQMRIAALTILS